MNPRVEDVSHYCSHFFSWVLQMLLFFIIRYCGNLTKEHPQPFPGLLCVFFVLFVLNNWPSSSLYKYQANSCFICKINKINSKYTDLECLPKLCAAFIVLVGILGSSGHSAACQWLLKGAAPQQVMTGLAGCFITLNWFGHAGLGSAGHRVC